MADVLAIALRLAPLSHHAIRAMVAGNTVAKLITLVESDLRRSDRVPPGRRENAANAWSRQRVDPELVGHLVAWLATGDEEVLTGAGARWRNLLSHNADLTHGDIGVLVVVAMESARRHLVRAQATDRAAISVDGEYTREFVRAASEGVKEHVTRELTREPVHRVAIACRQGRVRFNLPMVTTSFTGRRQELDELDTALAVADRAVITQAISGLGGVGKSQLAARYVQQRANDYDIVVWIRAEDGGIADLAALAAKIGLPIDGRSPSDCAQLALEWLSECDQRWLLVLDNIESPEQLESLRPRSGGGRVLVTWRDRALRQFGPVLSVDVFDENTAVTYLTDRADRPDDVTAARKLARALGCLPLALSHAAAYCQSGTSFSDYLALLDELPARGLFDSHPELSYAQTVASTWKASIQTASKYAPVTADVLEMAAHLGPDAIPKSLFLVLVDADTAIGRKRLADALNALARFSLATVDDDTVSVHRLLQKTIRDDAATHGQQTAALHALAALDDAFPDDAVAPVLRLPSRWPRCEQLLPHILALADALDRPGDAAAQLVNLLRRACDYLAFAEPGPRELSTAQITLRHAERLLEAEDVATLVARSVVGRAYRDAGRVGEALGIFESLVADDTRILGSEHYATLFSSNCLALTYLDDRRVAEATTLLESVVTTHERRAGAEHIATLVTRHNLARAYQTGGRVGDAIAIFEPLLIDDTRVLGAEYPVTLDVRHSLAEAYRDAGRVGEAIAIFEPLLTARERILGTEHPETLRTCHSLAHAYHEVGRIANAERVRKRAGRDQS
jgi:tetratricopeptide (TPR) repeat protein